MNRDLSDIQSDIIKGCTTSHSFYGTAVCAIHHIVDLLYHKREVSQNKVFYFTLMYHVDGLNWSL